MPQRWGGTQWAKIGKKSAVLGNRHKVTSYHAIALRFEVSETIEANTYFYCTFFPNLGAQCSGNFVWQTH